MADPFPRNTMTLDDDPQKAIQQVLELIRRLKNREEVMRQLQEQDADAKAAFESEAQAEWAALDALRASYKDLPPDSEGLARLEKIVERQEFLASLARSTYSAIADLILGVVPGTAAATGHSEQWLAGALSHIALPAKRRAQHAIDRHFEFEALAAEVDPSAGPVGDILTSPEDAPAWLARALAD